MKKLAVSTLALAFVAGAFAFGANEAAAQGKRFISIGTGGPRLRGRLAKKIGG